jgi:four helix bundle protein
LQIAGGSASELEYQLIFARELALLEPTSFQQLEHKVIEVKRMIFAFIQSLKSAP